MRGLSRRTILWIRCEKVRVPSARLAHMGQHGQHQSQKARERAGRETDRTRRRSSNAGHGGEAMASLLPLLVSPCVTGACCDYLAGASSCSGSVCAAGKYGQRGATSSSAATCTFCEAGTCSSAGASRVCLLRCPLFPARHYLQTYIPYASTCMHAGVLSRANGPLAAAGV